MNVYRPSGERLRATFHVAETDRGVTLYYESRGPGRNEDYFEGLDLLLGRAAEMRATVTRVELASRGTALAGEQRPLVVDEYPFPLVLKQVADLRIFRRRLTAAQAATGRLPGAKGPGNPTKRIRLDIEFPRDKWPEVEARLSGLGGRRYWAFLGDPRRYDVEGAVRDLQTDVWGTDGKPIARGDKAVIWKALGSDHHRGVVALADVISDPQVLPDSSNPYWRGPDQLATDRDRVELRYVLTAALPLWLGDPKAEILEDLSVARARGGSVFYLTPAQWDRILSVVGSPGQTYLEDDAIEEVLRPRERGPGQGYGPDSSSRRAVERHAMELAMEYYRPRWQHIHDVSARASYDLHLQNGADELRVEVKGTTGAGETVLLTHREVAIARANYPNTALFIVHGIELSTAPDGPIAVGGKPLEVRPWSPHTDDLTATAYRYQVPRAGEEPDASREPDST